MNVTLEANSNNTKNILELLEEMGYSLPCNCHGKHHCAGKQYSFDCSLIPQTTITISLPENNTVLYGVSFEDSSLTMGMGDTILIDIGTTTIALALIDKSSGALRGKLVISNPQRSSGSDIISRIQASIHGSLDRLKHVLVESLRKNSLLLCQKNHQKKEDINTCIIGGNTTMIHLLFGYDCTALSCSPFFIQNPSPAPFTMDGCEIIVFPWISAFVGGDITAGIYACRLQNGQDTALFVDLGTNGEMVLSHKGSLYTAATAAGPAFEGGNLSCGCPGIPGAINNVVLKNIRPLVQTIDNLLPIGLCGSGAISLCAELLRKHYVTTEGILTSRFPEDGLLLARTAQGNSLRFTADDFRNMQLAIAAIAAGIDTLAQAADILLSDIPVLYLGGGFGFYLSLADCQLLGMFSTLPSSRIQPMGNTCLRGLREYAMNAENLSPDSILQANIHSVSLADSDYFQKQFLAHMTYSDCVISTIYSD